MEPIQNSQQPEPDAPAETTEVDHASAFLERAASRAGVSLEPEPQEPAEAVGTPATAMPVAETERRPDTGRAHEEFRTRQQRRLEEAERRAERRLLEQLAERLEAQAVPPAAAASAAPEDPEPDMVENYQEWVAWDRRQRRLETEQLLDARLQPILSTYEQQQAWSQQQQQEQHQLAQRNAWYQQQAQLGREATEIYVATPEGQGFGERLAWRYGHPGDPARGLEPMDGSMTRALVAGGIPVEKARQITRANVHALQQFALDNNLNPAAFIDTIFRSEIADYAAAVGYQPPVSAGQPRQQQDSAAVRNVRQMRQTAASASSVAGTAAEGSPQGGPKTAGDLARAGEATIDRVMELARKSYGGNMKLAAKALREEAAKLQRSAG